VPLNKMEERRYKSTYSLTSVVDGGKRLASDPDRFNSGKAALVSHHIRYSVGRTKLYRNKIKSYLRREMNPSRPAFS